MNSRNLACLCFAVALTAAAPFTFAADPEAPAAAAGASSFNIVAGDDGADVMAITVKKGDKVSITFKVDPDRTYHAGLQFRSAKVETDPIRPGESATVTFVADSSFSLIPYWPS